MPTLAEAMLRDNPTIEERTDFSVRNIANTTGTLYKTNKTEDGSDVYYYSGNTTNNWVKFGKWNNSISVYRGYSETNSAYTDYSTLSECSNSSSYNYNCTETKINNVNDEMYWRIIRTNEDGSVRILYSGTNPDTTEGYIGTSTFNKNNNNPLNAGYMYGTTGSLENNRTNTNDSTIKVAVDTWYQNNLLTNYDKYISKTAIYCNDRSVGSGTYNISSTDFYYGSSIRLNTNEAPSYKCGVNQNNALFETTQAVADKFSASTDGGGNGQLKYPVSLMTADELTFAGGKLNWHLENPYAWYYTNSQGESIIGSFWSEWWSLSPNGFEKHIEGFRADMWVVFGPSYAGTLDSYGYGDGGMACPVISISKCATIKSGNGTPESPYEVDETSCN